MSDGYYHVNGEVVDAKSASVSVTDRGFRYGDAAFETLRAYGGDVFEWDAHRQRLMNTCRRLGMEAAVPDDLRSRVGETLSANEFEDAYVRVSVTRGPQSGTLAPGPATDPTVVVIAKPLPRGGVEGEPVWDGPARVETVATRRQPGEAIPANLKTHNYLNGILAREELSAAADEALMLDTDGNVAEGTVSNLFLVEEGTLVTPTTAGDVLPGVTRSVVLELADEEPFPVSEEVVGPDALRSADELFLTNTTWEVRPIGELDGRSVGVGPVTSLLSRLFDELVERRHY